MISTAGIRVANPRVNSTSATSSPCFDFGGIGVVIDALDRDWRRLALSRFPLSQPGRPPTLKIRYTPRSNSPPTVDDIRWKRSQPVEVSSADGRIDFEHPGFHAHYHRNQALLEVTGDYATYPLDLLLMTLWYDFVPQGLILHSALLADSGLGFACVGPSGSGKSTLARLFPQHAHCEELAAVVGRGSTIEVRSLPFWEEKPGEFPLAAMYVLEHGDRNDRYRQTPKQAAALLRNQIAWPVHDAKVTQKALSFFTSMIGSIPVFRLAFKPETSVWPLIAGEP